MKEKSLKQEVYTPKYIIDTWAWVEYFKGSEMGKLVMDKIELADNYTPTLVLAELRRWFTYNQKESFDDLLRFIKDRSTILDKVTEKTAIKGGEFRGRDEYVKRPKGKNPMSTVDGILMAMAEEKKMKVVTGDSDFEKFPYAEYIT